MFAPKLLTALFLALSVAANPILVDKLPVTLAISRRLNLTSVHNLVRHDQTRAKALKLRDSSKSSFYSRGIINEPVDNQALSYIASIGVGSPPTTYNLIVDTGSSNTWVGAGAKYVKTNTSSETLEKVSVKYGFGSFAGNEYIDTVTITPELVVTRQSIGVAVVQNGFVGVDGILGIGPVNLTLGTLRPDGSSLTIPTVTDNLFSNGVIDNNLIGISFEPISVLEAVNGEITWGGTDSSKFNGSITYVPLTTTAPSSYYWGIDQSILYGNETILPTTAGIVDTGTTLIYLATDAFTQYQNMTGAVLDNVTGLLRIDSDQYSKLESMFFVVGGTPFELTPNAQIWPRALNTGIGGDASAIYLIVNNLGSDSGQGFDFVCGLAFLERFYSVFDTGNQRVGLATTPFTNATTN